MIRAILDTNVIVQGLIGRPTAASACALDAYFDGRYRLQFSAETVDELLEVLIVPHIRARHRLSDSEILDFVAALLVNADIHSIDADPLSPAITRDPTDIPFVALCESSDSDFLVTNDRRHLLPLCRIGLTRVITQGEFLNGLE